MTYSLYKEVTLKWDQGNSFLIGTPWLELSIEVEKENLLKIRKQSDKAIDDRKYLDEDAQSFLSFFKDYPFLNIEPRQKLYAEESEFQLKPYPNADKFNYTWDIDTILNETLILNSNLYDPLSVYTKLSNLRYRDENLNQSELKMTSSLSELRNLDEEKFFLVAKILLRQSLEITRRCCECLEPAKYFSNSKQLVEEYIESEDGHYNFILHSLKNLNLSSKDIKGLPLLKETTESMEILKHSASTNFLAFSCIVAIFESAGFQDSDMLADQLSKSSLPKSAIGLIKHFEINKTEEHAQVGLEFAKCLGPVSRETVVDAARLMELITHRGIEMTKEIARYY